MPRCRPDGTSMRTGQPVGPEMFAALGRSLILAVSAILLMLVVAVPLGMAAALNQGRFADTATSLVSFVGIAFPEFVTATLLALVFADTLQWLPATGWVARDLGLAGGTPCLEVTRRTEVAGDWVTLVTQTYPGDRHELVAEFAPRVDSRAPGARPDQPAESASDPASDPGA